MSAARSAREAVAAYQTGLQLLFECVTPAVVITRGRIQRDTCIRHLQAPISFVLANGDRARLPATPTLYLEAAHDCLITRRPENRDWSVIPVGYAYVLSEEDGTEVAAYHWHPETTPDMVIPHFHLGPASSRRDSTRKPGEMHKVHFPTGIITLQDVIRLAIAEFGVEPRRPDWETILDQRPS